MLSRDSHATRPGASYWTLAIRSRSRIRARVSRRFSSRIAVAAGQGQREWGGTLQRLLVKTGTNISNAHERLRAPQPISGAKPLYGRMRRSVMRTPRTVLVFALLVGLALLLVACGGGGGGY